MRYLDTQGRKNFNFFPETSNNKIAIKSKKYNDIGLFSVLKAAEIF